MKLIDTKGDPSHNLRTFLPTFSPRLSVSLNQFFYSLPFNFDCLKTRIGRSGACYNKMICLLGNIYLPTILNVPWTSSSILEIILMGAGWQPRFILWPFYNHETLWLSTSPPLFCSELVEQQGKFNSSDKAVFDIKESEMFWVPIHVLP